MSRKLVCIKRLGRVLLGHVEPSVEAVVKEAHAVIGLIHQQPLGPALHKCFDGSLIEPLPADFSDMLQQIDQAGGPRHYVPSKGGLNGKGRHRPD